MQKIRKLITGIGAAMLAATLTFGSVPVYAATTTGTITISAPDGFNGSYNIYKVADFTPETETLGTIQAPFNTYDGTDDLALTMENLKDQHKFTQISNAVAGKVDVKETTPVVSGLAKNTQSEPLDFGLYFVALNNADGYKMTSFLVFVPQKTGSAGDATITINVDAKPKMEKPETPPSPPGPPDNPPPDNPPDNPKTPPTNPPEEETPPETPPTEDIGNLDDNGNMNENGNLNEGGALTGDNSQIAVYGAVAGAAAVVLIVWFFWRRKKNKEQ